MSGSLEITRDFTGGQVAAILQKVVGEGSDKEKIGRLRAILRDEYNIQLVKRILKLAGKNGRIIPREVKSAVCDANKDFHLIQPSLETVADYAARLARFQKAFETGPVMSAAEFEGISKNLIDEIKGHKDICNLLNGICLPIILPPLSDFTDYGTTLEQIFVPAAKFAYERQFPDKKFHNYREGDLAGKISIVPESRHDRLIAEMKKGPVVALYFPGPLQGFSILASREQMTSLPESLVLSGGVDAFSAMAMHPDVLARDFHTPGYDLDALTWQSPGYSLYLHAYDDGLSFDCRGNLGGASDSYSSGLVFLGSA